MPGAMLITGATGTVGTDLVTGARGRGWEVVGCARSGGDGVAAWDMAAGPPPAELRRPWDVVVHAAARVEWTMSAAEAWRANVEPLNALEPLIGERTHLILVSTAFATGHQGTIASRDQRDYRNTYEWSKAAAERIAIDRHPALTIVRPPLVIGRRDDGFVARFAGIYPILRSLSMNLVPAVVGERDALLEMVSTSDVTACCLDLAGQPRPQRPRTLVLGRGSDALALHWAFEFAIEVLNERRARHGTEPISMPPFVTPEQWTRFFFPFARRRLDARRVKIIQRLDQYLPYLAIREPLAVTWRVDPVEQCLRRSIEYWADCHPRFAMINPSPWT